MDLFELLFGSNGKSYDPEAWRGSNRSRHHGRSRNNWTSSEDWNCAVPTTTACPASTTTKRTIFEIAEAFL